MGFPLFRVTLSNDIEGSLVISEPGGWDEAKLKLERNEEFHSLVEYYDQPLTFYGDDIAEDGGINFIRNIEQTQGPDAQITITIEVSHDEGDTYEELVENTVEVESIKEMDFYKLESGVIRNGFWQYFINRRDIPVNLYSLNDLDGNARTVINPITIPLPSQKMRETSSQTNIALADYLNPDITPPASYNFTTTLKYGQFGLTVQNLDEIKERYNYPLERNSSIPFELFGVEYSGSYRVQLQVFAAEGSLYIAGLTNGNMNNVSLRIQVNDDAPITATRTVIPGNTPFPVTASNITLYEYDDVIDLQKGDLLRIYWEYTGASTRTFAVVYDDSIYYDTISTEFLTESFFTVTGDTIYDDTDCEGFLIHDAGNSITDRIIGRDGTFYSEYLGNTQTQIQSYAEDGCGSMYAVARGLNIRGYSLTEKPFFMTFNTWWNGINPILNLGLGYERLGSPEVEVLRIEPKEYFYNEMPSVYLDFVNNIERGYDMNYIWKVIEFGFEKWSIGSNSGLDDPQTKRTYNTRFKTIGKDIRIMSKFIGASLVWEQTRRSRSEQGKDFNTDEDVFIVSVNLNGTPEFTPELDENFTEVSGLLNAETRYNIRISVARNFERWKSFFNGCLQWYVADGDSFRFASGDGNFSMESVIDSSDCEATDESPEPTIGERMNRTATNNHLFMPVTYSFEHYLTWDQYKTIRDNRNQAIGVSRTDADHKICFIKSLEYEITHGRASFVVNVKGSESGYDPEDVYFT